MGSISHLKLKRLKPALSLGTAGLALLMLGIGIGFHYYSFFAKIYIWWRFDPARYEHIEPLALETDPASLIRLKRPEDVLRLRKRLIRHIWKSGRIPSGKPHKIERGISDPAFTDLRELRRLDRLVVRMEHEFSSIIYLFWPREKASWLVLYHAGHEGDFDTGKATIAGLLDAGHAVMAFSVPSGGKNGAPITKIPGLGRIQFASHHQYPLLETPRFTPLKFWAHPVAVALNHAVAEGGFTRIAMTGLSGGGWTTTLYAALDPRITASYPVAGSLPLYLRSGDAEYADYEHNAPGLYRIANYLELYALASHGLGRRQIQILNKYDSCCYGGVRYRLYEPHVQAAVERLGPGRFEVLSDDNHREHKISEQALQRILADLAETPR